MIALFFLVVLRSSSGTLSSGDEDSSDNDSSDSDSDCLEGESDDEDDGNEEDDEEEDNEKTAIVGERAKKEMKFHKVSLSTVPFSFLFFFKHE